MKYINIKRKTRKRSYTCSNKKCSKKRKIKNLSKKNKKLSRKRKNLKGGGIFGLPDISFKYTFSQGIKYPRDQCPPYNFEANEFLQGYNNNL